MPIPSPFSGEEREHITATAIIHRGEPRFLSPPARHGTVMKEILRIWPEDAPICGDQGFITSTGRFVDRREAKKIAVAANQLLPTAMDHDELYSEDVW